MFFGHFARNQARQSNPDLYAENMSWRSRSPGLLPRLRKGKNIAACKLEPAVFGRTIKRVKAPSSSISRIVVKQKRQSHTDPFPCDIGPMVRVRNTVNELPNRSKGAVLGPFKMLDLSNLPLRRDNDHDRVVSIVVGGGVRYSRSRNDRLAPISLIIPWNADPNASEVQAIVANVINRPGYTPTDREVFEALDAEVNRREALAKK
jgi:hypothetical protein